MLYSIYILRHPDTKDVVYVGQTKDLNLTHYLNSKYWKLNEVNKGGRNNTPLFDLMKELLPKRLIIEEIRKVDDSKPFDNPDFLEWYYIKEYSKQYKLLNRTNGGIGGNTYKYKTKEEISAIGKKISIKLKGKNKSENFKQHLSETRIGNNNPNAKKLSKKVAVYSNDELIDIFEYGYQIDNFIGYKGAYSNIKKYMDCNVSCTKMGYTWKPLNS